MSHGVETLRGQDRATFGAAEEPSVDTNATRSESVASRLRVVWPMSEALVTHRSEPVGSAPELRSVVQPFSSTAGGWAVAVPDAVASAPGVAEGLGVADGAAVCPAVAPSVASGAGVALVSGVSQRWVTSVEARAVQSLRPVTDR